MSSKSFSFYGLIIGGVGCLLPLVMSTRHFLFSLQTTVLQVSILACGLLTVLFLWSGKYQCCISRNDFAVFIYFCWCGIAGWVADSVVPAESVFKWLSLLGVYVICRNIEMHSLMLFLFLGGVVEAGTGILQLSGHLESRHELFGLTGSFETPAHLGGYLAILLTLLLGNALTLIYPVNKRKFLFLLSAFIPFVFLLILSDSRAAWLACLLGILYLFLPHFTSRSRLLRRGILILLLLGTALYFYKPISAASRLYIWNISLQMIGDEPWFGHGTAAFSRYYMLYQAEYFESLPLSGYASIADQVTSPYNEWIHVATEQGVVGCLLLLYLFFTFLWPPGSGKERVYRGGIFAFMVFACFAFPGENYPLLYWLAVFMGNLRGKALLCFDFSGWAKYPVILAVLATGGWTVVQYREYRQEMVCLLQKGTKEMAETKQWQNNPEVLQYLLQVADSLPLNKQLAVQHRVAYLLPAPQTYCDLGKLYEQTGQYRQAESCYRTAAHMVPRRIKANYCLYKLYESLDWREKKLEMARVILQQKVKIENTFTLAVQGEVRQFLINSE